MRTKDRSRCYLLRLQTRSDGGGGGGHPDGDGDGDGDESSSEMTYGSRGTRTSRSASRLAAARPRSAIRQPHAPQRHSAAARPAAPYGKRTHPQPSATFSTLAKAEKQRYGSKLRSTKGSQCYGFRHRSDRDFAIRLYTDSAVVTRDRTEQNLQQTRTVQWSRETVQRTCNIRAMLSCATAWGMSAACGDGSERGGV